MQWEKAYRVVAISPIQFEAPQREEGMRECDSRRKKSLAPCNVADKHKKTLLIMLGYLLSFVIKRDLFKNSLIN